MPEKERTYQEDEYFDVGEELARSWAEIERWRQSQPQTATSPTMDIPDASTCPPNAIGRTHPTIGEIARRSGRTTLGGE